MCEVIAVIATSPGTCELSIIMDKTASRTGSYMNAWINSFSTKISVILFLLDEHKE